MYNYFVLYGKNPLPTIFRTKCQE